MIEALVPALPLETVTPIKPSEAIRLGCLLAPVQSFGQPYERPNGACAVGAMMLGYGNGRLPDDAWDWMCDAPCPLGCVKPRLSWGPYAGPSVVAHLNDAHRWTREAIADWLESAGL